MISLKNCQPIHTDKFFVDSNVWFWITYCASKEINTGNKPKRYQLENYPVFIEKILDIGAKLFHCPLVFSELANVIERTEYEIYNDNNRSDRVSRKRYRAIESERAKVINEIRMAWTTVNSMSTCLDLNLNEDTVPPALARLESAPLDAYDAFYLQVMSSEGITKLISDDRDFNMPGLDLFISMR